MNDSAMDTRQVKAELARLAALTENWLARALAGLAAPARLLEAMRYSLEAGGKRVRPALCLLSAMACGEKAEAVLPFASAIECIHTYSLIHDDLPAMDDDDLRRGKPSCHKRFDEATAILAGDGLLTDAFLFMTRSAGAGIPAARVLEAVALAARAAGSAGMVGGQCLDMQYTAARDVSLEELAHMQALKTGAMIRMSCEAGAVLAGAPEEITAALAAYGAALGAAFQIADDVLDVTGSEQELGKPVGSDQARNKCTWPALIGLDASAARARECSADAVRHIASLHGPYADCLRGLALYVVERVS